MVIKAKEFNTNGKQLDWRVNEYAQIIGLGHAYTYEMIREGRIKSVKCGGARIITTPPEEFIASLKPGGEI